MSIQHEPLRCLCLGGMTAGVQVDLECRCDCHTRAMTFDELREVFLRVMSWAHEDAPTLRVRMRSHGLQARALEAVLQRCVPSPCASAAEARMSRRILHTGPLWNPDGSVAVEDLPQLRSLRRALERGLYWRKRYQRRRARQAWRERRRALGIKGPPMPAHVKELLRGRRQGRSA